MEHIVLVEFVLVPGAAAEFERLIVDNATRSVSDEPGCLRFDVLRPPAAPDTIVLYEVYTDAEAFAAHRASAHFLSFDRAAATLVASKRIIQANYVAGSPPAK